MGSGWRLEAGCWRLRPEGPLDQGTSALAADPLALERRDIVVAPAKGACHLQLADHDPGALDTDQQLVTLANVEQPPSLGWNNDPSQIIDLSNDPRFQAGLL